MHTSLIDISLRVTAMSQMKIDYFSSTEKCQFLRQHLEYTGIIFHLFQWNIPINKSYSMFPTGYRHERLKIVFKLKIPLCTLLFPRWLTLQMETLQLGFTSAEDLQLSRQDRYSTGLFFLRTRDHITLCPPSLRPGATTTAVLEDQADVEHNRLTIPSRQLWRQQNATCDKPVP